MSIVTRTNGKSLHSGFWEALTKNSDSVALSQLWLCCIDSIRLWDIGYKMTSLLNNYEIDSWNKEHQEAINSELLGKPNWEYLDGDKEILKSSGDAYLWVQGISFLPEGIDISRVGPNRTGATKGLISEGRSEHQAVNITFLESNVSFVDGFLRPWAVLNSYKSLKDSSLRCDIEFISLMKWDISKPLKIRKTMLLKNAVPVSIDQEEYNYTGDKIISRQVQFAFDRYENRVYGLTAKDNVTGRDIEDIIDLRYRVEEKKDEEEEKKKGLLERSRDILNKAAEAVNKVQGIADKVTSTAAQTLRAFGMDKIADKVSQANIKFQNKITSPVANVIGTGQGMANSVDRMGSLINDFAGGGRVDVSGGSAEQVVSKAAADAKKTASVVSTGGIDKSPTYDEVMSMKSISPMSEGYAELQEMHELLDTLDGR